MAHMSTRAKTQLAQSLLGKQVKVKYQMFHLNGQPSIIERAEGVITKVIAKSIQLNKHTWFFCKHVVSLKEAHA